MEATGDSSLVLNDRPYQKVELHANKDSSHISIYGTEVDIYSSPIEYGASCSQVIVEDMVDYGWKEKYYHGRIISIHISGKYLAYVLKPSNNKPGLVRVLRIHLETRCLIKDYKNEVKDIAFAHTTSQVLLGSVDACGELLVHKIVDDGTILVCNLLIRITRPSDWIFSDHNRIIWCMFIPDDNDNDEDANVEDLSTLLVVTHNEKAEIWNIQTVINDHGHGDLTVDEVKVGVQVILEHKQPITAATFSPDATALAIGSLEGIVKFFQVNTLDKDVSPRCLHQWTPHPEKSLSSLYFLDNHKNHRPDMQFWKYAVTGAENNTELKIWSCETWACLQTIRLHPNSGDCVEPCLKAEIDLSSKYLFLSDIKRKVLYILLIQQDALPSNASIVSFSEFKVPLPVLSLSIASVNYRKSQSIVGGKGSDDEGEVDNIEEVLNDVDEIHGQYVVKLFWIQTKSLQSCRISYTPKMESPLLSVGSIGSLSQESYVYKDGLSDVSLDARDASNRSVKDLDVSLQKGMCVDELSSPSPSNSANLSALPSHMTNFSNCTEVLLTPDDFTSPSHSNLTVQNYQDAANSASKCDSSSNLTDGIDSLPVEPNTLQRRKSSQHSATSSPSREVAEILAPSKVLHLDGMGNENENESLTAKDEAGNLTNSLNSYGISSGSRNKLDIKSEYHVNNWPQAPIASQEYLTASRNESESTSNQIFHSSNGESSAVTFETNANRALLQMNQNFHTMAQKMDTLTSVLRDQRCEIQSLQNEIKLLRQEQKHSQTAVSFSNKLDQIISQQLVPDYSRLETVIVRTAEESRQHSEKNIAIMTDEIASNFGNRLENTLKYELSTTVIPQVNNVLDTVGQKMQLDFSQKLALTDASLKECVSKHLKGKVFLDSLSQSVAASIHSQIQSTCKDVFLSNVIPAFEKACQHLFQQLNDTFSTGIQEYMQSIESHSQSSCSTVETGTAQLREEVNSLISSAQKTINSQVSLIEKHNGELKKHQDALLSGIRQSIREEVVKAFKEQTTSVLNSRAVTPVPQTDFFTQKQRMLQLIQQGNINEAFQQALSAMDVQIVIFLCESVNPDQVFGSTPCPLQQHVLLSLVNQLSADLSVKTDIKVRYIEDVIATLDSNNPIIRDHINGVLENLQQRISNFIQRNPTHKLSRNLKRLNLAVGSLINT
ncbi:enhancer of mRNA-decapping protein 4-like isoform X2 [Uloborus diversus]|nr:enhancer of mRNA-decapping protein 4-like isoform X2 [Uloborus diversus]